MANLYPPSIADKPGIPESEKHVFEKLKALDNTYHVYHSVSWNDGRDGECDFIIFNELKGFITLEVKGGRISYDGYNWRSTDSEGITHSIKNPAEQARTSMFTIKKIYEKKYNTALPGIYTWGVCFLDADWKSPYTTLELSDSNVLDAHGMDDPQSWIDNLFKESEKRHGTRILSAKEKSGLMTLFSRSLSVPMSISRILEEQQRRLGSANTNQEYLLDLFEDKNRIAFQGAAGTGKTWIAMKKALRLAGSGKRVLFLCYNKPLSTFIGDRLCDNNNIEVMTFHSFSQAVIRDFIAGQVQAHGCAESFFALVGELAALDPGHEPGTRKEPSDKSLQQKINSVIGILASSPGGLDYKSAIAAYSSKLPAAVIDVVSLLLPSGSTADDFYSERLPLAVTCAFEAGTDHLDNYTYDAMIVDEGQDFHHNWCDTLKFIFDKYRSRVVYLFYDDNQTIFTGRGDLPITGLIANSGLTNYVFRLRDNLRNTRNIHDFAVEKTGLGGTAKSGDINGIAPVEENFTIGKSAIAYIESILGELINEHAISRENIIILSNRSIENSIFADDHKAGEFSIVSTGEGKRDKSVRFRTIHQFKGLESDVVILLLHRRAEDMAEKERYLSEELMYVGYSRARHLLYVVNAGQGAL